MRCGSPVYFRFGDLISGAVWPKAIEIRLAGPARIAALGGRVVADFGLADAASWAAEGSGARKSTGGSLSSRLAVSAFDWAVSDAICPCELARAPLNRLGGSGARDASARYRLRTELTHDVQGLRRMRLIYEISGVRGSRGSRFVTSRMSREGARDRAVMVPPPHARPRTSLRGDRYRGGAPPRPIAYGRKAKWRR